MLPSISSEDVDVRPWMASRSHRCRKPELKYQKKRLRQLRQNLNRLKLAIPCLLLSLFAGCAWPVFRGNTGRTGRSGIDTSSNQGIQQWAFFTGQSPQDSVYGPVIGIPSPTIGGIYVGDLGGILYSVTPAGTLAWKISLPVLNSASPNAIGVDGTVYVADNFGSLYAVSSSGTLEWSFPVPGGLSPAKVATSTDCTPAAGCQTTIYTGNHCGVFYALDSGGNVKWTFSAFQRSCRVDTPTISPAIASDGTIYSGVAYAEPPGTTGVLFALNSNGTLLWSSNTYAGTPAIDPNSGILYVVSLDRLHLYALNSQGVLQWQFDAPQTLTLPAIASDGTIYVGTWGSGFWALNPNGTTKWQTSPIDPNTGLSFSDFDSPPIIGGDGTMYIVSSPPELFAINPDSTVKWDADSCIGGGGGQGAGLSPNEPVIGTGGTIYVQYPLPSDTLGPCPLEAFH